MRRWLRPQKERKSMTTDKSAEKAEEMEGAEAEASIEASPETEGAQNADDAGAARVEDGAEQSESLQEETQKSEPKPSKRPVVIGAIVLVLAVVLLVFAVLFTQPQGSQVASSDPVLNTSDLSGGVAATVNGTEIGENAVTAYVQRFRETNGLTDNDAWGTWLIDNAYTMDSFRADTVDYFVNQELLRQAAEKEGVSVTQDEVDDAIQAEIDEVGDETSWREGLEKAGATEESERSQVELSLLQQALMDKVCADVAASDDELLAYAQMYYEDYADAESLDEVPDDIVEQLREMADPVAQRQAFAQYMIDFRNSGDVLTMLMPEGLPYVIDLAPYEEAYYESQDQ